MSLAAAARSRQRRPSSRPDGRQHRTSRRRCHRPPFSGTDTPGLYQVIQRDAAARETNSFFAANFVNARESHLAAGARVRLRDRRSTRASRSKRPRSSGNCWRSPGWCSWRSSWRSPGGSSPPPTCPRAAGARASSDHRRRCWSWRCSGWRFPRAVDRQATVFVADVSASVADRAAAGLAEFHPPGCSAPNSPTTPFAVVTTARSASRRAGHCRALRRTPWRSPDRRPVKRWQPTWPLACASAADVLPSGYRPRLVLLSDGQETSGDAVAQARSASCARRPGRRRTACPAQWPRSVGRQRLDAANVVNEGERFSVGVRLDSNVSTDGSVHVFVNNQHIADQAVSLSPGSHRPRLQRAGPRSLVCSTVRASSRPTRTP